MKLKIDNKYVDVEFWSLMKCFILVEIALNLIIGSILIAIGYFFW